MPPILSTVVVAANCCTESLEGWITRGAPFVLHVSAPRVRKGNGFVSGGPACRVQASHGMSLTARLKMCCTAPKGGTFWHLLPTCQTKRTVE